MYNKIISKKFPILTKTIEKYDFIQIIKKKKFDKLV